jgi:mannose-6-phosphate isomerase-like protein (cupin superfamily)
MHGKISMDEVAGILTKPYTHVELGQVNDHAVYVMHFKGDYPFHKHTKDELYLVLEGEIRIRFKNEPEILLKMHDSVVVRAYTTHSPGSDNGALVLMVKPKEMFGDPLSHD